jgi:hypothetical protein
VNTIRNEEDCFDELTHRDLNRQKRRLQSDGKGTALEHPDSDFDVKFAASTDQRVDLARTE